jgi:hypothetical protein
MINNRLRKPPWCSLAHTCAVCLFLTLISQSLAGDQVRNNGRDRDALIGLENEWLKNERNATELERILASDFLHPVATGDMLTRAQHIEYSSKHLPPAADRASHFENLKVRIYGDVGIVNGLVVTTHNGGNTVDKSIFTDVFVYRDGRWQAVNAQENVVTTLDKSH